jgi:hypothetical protein
MTDDEKWEKVKKLNVGDKIIAKIGDHIIGVDELEMEYYDRDENKKMVYARFYIRKSRFNPKGRVDNYYLPLNRIILQE